MKADMMPLLVSGPTAGGKSALALFLAKKFEAEVLSIDSVSVYRECDIGSAKLLPEERQGIPHWMLDCWSPQEEGNLGRYREELQSVLEDLARRNRRALFCGGTTMYLEGILAGLASLPAANPELRERIRRLSSQDCYERLQMLDPERAKALHPQDRLRVERALELCELGPGPASSLRVRQGGLPSFLGFVLVWNREELYRRIDRRSHDMLKQGLLDESRTLYENYGPGIPIFKTLGFAQCLQVFEGKLSIDALAEAISKGTRRYAKRQMTFWRNAPAKHGWELFPKPGQGDKTLGDEGKQSGLGRKGFEVYSWNRERLTEEIEKFSQQFSGGQGDGLTQKAIYALDAAKLFAS